MSKILKATSLFVFLLLISGFVFSSPQKTQAACTAKPAVAVVGYQGGVRSVTYTVRVTNRCGGARNFRLLVSQLPTSPQRLVADWEIPAGSGRWNQAFFTSSPIPSGGSRNFTVRVRRNIDVFHPNGTYYNVVFKANVREGGSVIGTFGTRATHYVVQNRPDFEFRSFSFPGGLTCINTKPTVIIRNVGWVGTGQDIVVQVKNRAGGQTFNRTVSQYISKREIIDISNKFSGMDRPAPGTYDAIAVVDLNKNVTEEDEGNNRATSRYSTSPCNPRGYHDSSSCEVTNGWACDPDNFGRALTIHFYEGSTYLGATTANRSRPDVKNAGRCGTNANVGFSWTHPAGLKDGRTHTIRAFALNVGPTGGNIELPSNRSFTCPVAPTPAPATPTNAPSPTPITAGYQFISGGLFEDKNNNQKQDRNPDPLLDEDFISGTFGLKDIIRNINFPTETSQDGGQFRFRNLQPGTYTVTYLKKADDVMSIPKVLIGNPAIGNITIGASDCIDGTLFDCDSNGNAINVLFGIEDQDAPIIPKTWLQGVGGDMRVDEKDWFNDMPTGKYFSKDDAGQQHGIVFGNNLNLGLGLPNSSPWFIEDVPYDFPVVKTKYSEMYKQIYVKGFIGSRIHDDITSTVCLSSPCSLNTNEDIKVYTLDNDLILGNSTITSPKKHVFLINGNLTITDDITIAAGAFAMFVVSGDIIIKPSAENIDGIFSTDKNFIVEGTTPLTINGSVIVNAEKKDNTLENEREGGDSDNPSVNIIYRPDLVLNAPSIIMTTSYSISEVAPGAQSNP